LGAMRGTTQWLTTILQYAQRGRPLLKGNKTLWIFVEK